MQVRTLTAAVTVALLMWAPVGTGFGHDTASHEPAGQPEADPAAIAGASDRIVIERTLGDGPVETVAVPRGATIRLVLHAPAGTELHLHGYDLSGTAAAGAPVVITFRADHPGRFAIEAHGIEDLLGRADRALAYLEVRPE